MPAPKSQLMRYKIINAMLLSTRQPYPTLLEIQREMARQDIKVGIRAIEKDFEAMRYDKRLGYKAPIAFSRKYHGYHYTKPDYTIDKLPLSSDELESFKLIVESFKRFRGARVLKQLEGMFDKLDKVVMQQMSKSKKRADYPAVDFETAPYSKGIEHFDALYEAIIKQLPLTIHYKKFDDDKATEHTFHPYLLKEYKFRWYLLGYSEKRKGKLILALDRIESVQKLRRRKFKPYKGVDMQKYFYHTIGITITKQPVHDIRLWFSRAQGHYIKTQHLHATQHILSDDANGLVASFQLVPNYELLQTLLAFGPEVKILEPSTLQTAMKEMLEKSLALYS